MTSLLIVEDDPHFRRTLARELEDHGFEVRSATSVDEAIASIVRDPVDVVLTDLRLGGQDGIDLLRRLPSASRRTRAILMSAYATARDHQIATELGAVTVLVKPFTWDELLRTIQKAIESETGFVGSIHGLSLVDMAQMFHLGLRSISVRIGQPGEPPSTIHFERGEIVHAEHRELRGSAALRAILATPSGTIGTAPLADDVARTIDAPFEHLLLESLSQLDEEQHQVQRAARAPELAGLQVRDDEPGAASTPTPQPGPPASEPDLSPLLARLGDLVHAPAPERPHDPIFQASQPPTALQPGLTEACRVIVAAIDAAIACGIVAIDSGLLIGHHQIAALGEPVGPSLAAATRALFADPALVHLAALEPGPAGVDVTREAQLTAPRHHFFARVLGDGRSAVALLTRRTINIGMGWALLRANLGRLEAQIR